MCDTLLRQSPTGVGRRGLATLTYTEPADAGVQPPQRRQVLGRHPADLGRRRLQPRSARPTPSSAASTAQVFEPGQLDHGDQPDGGHDQAQPSPTTGCRASCRSTRRVHHREEVRRGRRGQVRHPGRRRDVHRPVQATRSGPSATSWRSSPTRTTGTRRSRPRRPRSTSRASPPTRRSPPASRPARSAAATRSRSRPSTSSRPTPTCNVYLGTSYESDAFIVSNSKGPLGDVRVRQALSMAIDRQGLIDANYKGAALLPRDARQPRHVGLRQAVFQKGWDALPEPKVNIDAAKALIKAAGAHRQDDHARHVERAPEQQHRGDRGAVRRRGASASRSSCTRSRRPTTSTSSSIPRPASRRRVLHRQLPRLRRPGRAVLPPTCCPTARRTTTATTIRR